MKLPNSKHGVAATWLCAAWLAAVISGCGGGGSSTGPHIGGDVTGLSAGNTVVLQRFQGPGPWDGAVDTVTISQNGTYRFPNQVAAGQSSYIVNVTTQPGNQFCWISKPVGQLTSADVTDIMLSCGPSVATAASMALPRTHHAAILLANGKVLVSGGVTSNSPTTTTTATAELYDPAGDSWSSAASMPAATSGHTMTLLANGRVLALAAGAPGAPAAAYLYDPLANSWSVAASMNSISIASYYRTQQLTEVAVKTSLQNDQAAWQQFRAQKGQAELAADIAKQKVEVDAAKQ